MIFFYSGWGILVPLLGVIGASVALVIDSAIGDAVAGHFLYLCFTIGGLIAGGSCWWLGTNLNHPRKGEIVIDPKTRDRRLKLPRHGFMFIAMQYYAVIYFLIFGCLAIGAYPHNSGQRHSANTDIFGLSHVLAAVASPASAAGDRQVLSWQFGQDKDALTDNVTPKADSEVLFPDGVTVEAEATCDTGGVDIAFATFRGHTGLPLAGRDSTIELRMRVDQRPERVTTAQRPYLNSAAILFYDPQAAADAIHGLVPDTHDRISNLFTGLVGSLGMAQIQASAGGTISDLMSAGSVRVELRLEDGSAEVVDLNPRDTALRQLVKQCIPPASSYNGDTNPQSGTNPEQPSAFQQGLADRQTLERWIDGLSGASRDGALFWAAHRSDPSPPSCSAAQGQPSATFTQGCLKAKEYLARADARRNSDADYRRGWNSY